MDTGNDTLDGLRSLYDALEIPQTGQIKCFARLQNLNRCPHGLPNTRKLYINGILEDIVARNSKNEDAKALEAVQSALVKLTELLECSNAKRLEPHARGCVVDGKRYSKQGTYILFIVSSRLQSWQSQRRMNQDPSNRSPPSTPPKLGPSTPKTGRTHDRYLIEVNCKEDDEGEVVEGSSEAWKQASLRRPKLARENQMRAQETLATPTRPRGSRSRHSNIHATVVQEEPRDSLFSPTLEADRLIMSPGSVASPASSEVFTPCSTVSTPDSLRGTPELYSRRSIHRHSSCEKQREESPTRRSGLADDSMLLSDMMQRMDLNEEDVNAESETKQSVEEPLSSSPSRLPMKFSLKKQLGTSPVRLILKYMTDSVSEKSLDSGYVYCFAEKSAPGYLKIGYTTSKELNGNIEPPISSSAKKRNKDKVRERLQRWAHSCDHDLDPRFELYMPCAVRMMEGLIHRTLHEEGRKAVCPSRRCHKKHTEWFEISESEALAVAKVWQQFSESMPYNDMAELSELWQKHVSIHRRAHGSLATREWLATEWATTVVDVTNRGEKMKKKMERLQYNLAQVQEKRRAAERQQELNKAKILVAQEEEELLQRELEKLNICNV
ncbi:hypothetical protein NW762_004493 [Fusarium torreyae]|uniref:Bacteriophage T5 Orf172 DNA-binding domain-containing protein n=1 Tax=Fusarium torreyae TaxID=1237075 RepID=A0A9W8S8G5_9HYPO|nr:hypothetical protein NW762_004493 [Fusarium torreyae]